ncbi:MAG: hypothetical protein FJY95_19520 [Candidatus Handelsmanbacteria bacterium]|nr:hypothetical protein [Candidatus Handelsmanbacteria bacterium]
MAEGSRLATLWVNRQAVSDPPPQQVVDLAILDPAVDTEVGIDILNGREQVLAVTREGGRAVIQGVALDNFPVMIRF